MLAFTRKTDYALVALAGLAAQSPKSASAHELAERLHLPLPALRNILKRLAKHGLIVSTQGPTGGYRLARSPEQITLAEVVQAVQGPIRLALCCGPQGEKLATCQLDDSCRIKSTVRHVHQRLMDFLGEVSLSQIVAGEFDEKEMQQVRISSEAVTHH